MQLAQIRLQSTNAQINMSTTPAVQEIEQPQADLSIEQPKAELSIETTPGQLTIDQTKAREDVDLKSIGKRIEEFAQYGRQDWLSGLARMAQEGNSIMKIENGGNPIAEIGKSRSEGEQKQFNIGWIPSHFSVKTNYTPAKVDIQVKVNQPIINSKINKPIHNYRPAKVNIEVGQKQSLNIDFVNLKHVGIKYEQEI